MTVTKNNLLPLSPPEIMLKLAERAKALRLGLNLSQSGLASRSGVSLGSIRRFESTGEISLKSLLNLALVLRRLDEFNELFKPSDVPETLFATDVKKPRKRGRRK